ncbi:MAG: hypothetical protein NT014_06180, partial [Candidatus Omnitrophica bacterium]|nr:hypothetical protein [Candidatus Omnitrophota bacterium]
SSEQVIKIINDNLKINKTGRKVKSLFIVQNWGFYSAINYLWIVKKVPWDLWISAYEKPGDNFGRQLTQSDFIIIEDMAQDAVPKNSKYLYEAFKQNTDKFEFVKTVLLPSVYSQDGNKSSAGTEVRIYKRINV